MSSVAATHDQPAAMPAPIRVSAQRRRKGQGATEARPTTKAGRAAERRARLAAGRYVSSSDSSDSDDRRLGRSSRRRGLDGFILMDDDSDDDGSDDDDDDDDYELMDRAALIALLRERDADVAYQRRRADALTDQLMAYGINAMIVDP